MIRPSCRSCFLISRAVEALDARRLLAASLNNGLLTITGTSGADVVTVVQAGNQIVVQEGALRTSFAAASVTGITAGLGNGDDSIKLASTLNIPATLSGEAGNDTLVGGAANDALYGGSGNDIAQGNAGNDNIELATGDDTLDGGTGNDTLDGGDGTDTVTYESRSTPITGSLMASRVPTPDNQGQPPFTVSLGGTVSAAGGEHDALKNAETLTGGGGDDSLTSGVSGQSWESGVTGPVPTVRINGGGGNDVLGVFTGYADSHALNTLPMIADGGVGDDSLAGGDFAGVTFVGGKGNDTISFGNDDSSLPTIDAGPGFDTVDAHLPLGISSYTIPFGVEKISIGAAGGHLTIFGNAEDNIISVGGIETVYGGGGNDLITTYGGSEVHGDAGNDTLVGSDDLDTLDGGGGNDSLVGGGGDDSLYGSAGDDTLDGGTGNDTLNGGSGRDTVTYAGRSAAITGSLHALLQVPTPNPQWALDGSGGAASESDQYLNVETLTGGDGNDTLSTSVSDGYDTSYSAQIGFTLRVNGGNGDDQLKLVGAAAFGNALGRVGQVADGGAGNDALTLSVGEASDSTLVGGIGDDTFTSISDDQDATIDPGAGFDLYKWFNTPGFSYVMPPGLEAFTGAGASIEVTGNSADNQITVSGTGITKVSGGGGNDKIVAQNLGSSVLTGGDGDDTLTGTDGNDTIDAGAGDDVVSAGNGDDSLRGGDGDDQLSGGSGSDTIRGDAGDDRLDGNGGSDRLYGGDGRDRLAGSGGNDYLDGGSGIDSLYGGDGSDRAVRDRKDRIVREIETLV